MRNTNQGPFTIHVGGDADPLVVDRYMPDSFGVTYETEGCEVFVPWHRVEAIVRYTEDYEPTEPAEGDEPAEADEVDDESDDEVTDEPPATSGKADFPKASNADMRAWAQAHGIEVSASGPVSNDVATKFAAAHADS
jgi:hypothetical protein